MAKLSDKEEVEFDKALLATGANVRILRVDGAQLDGIHYLRTSATRTRCAKSSRVPSAWSLIGGSYIGTELAASFTKLGKQCELIMLESGHARALLPGPRWAVSSRTCSTSHGVKVHGSQELERFEGSDERVQQGRDQGGARDRVRLRRDRRRRHPGARGWREQAGLETDQGVLVDRYLETSAPGMFAAGDIAEYDSVVHGRRLRIEHWDVAFNQGKYAALNMLGSSRSTTSCRTSGPTSPTG